jgi:hypothetical protein
LYDQVEVNKAPLAKQAALPGAQATRQVVALIGGWPEIHLILADSD